MVEELDPNAAADGALGGAVAAQAAGAAAEGRRRVAVGAAAGGAQDGDEGRDADFDEKSIKVVLQFVRLGVIPLQESEKEMLATVLSKVTKEEAVERWMLESQDWDDLQKASKL